MYEIRTRWTNMIVYRTLKRDDALLWLEHNNTPNVFRLVRIKCA